MKSGEPVLYPNKTIAGLVTEYAKEHSASLPEYLLNYHDNVVVNQLGAHMMISTFQGQAMVWIARLIGAKKGQSWKMKEKKSSIESHPSRRTLNRLTSNIS